jgi:Rieske Fe-S protein
MGVCAMCGNDYDKAFTVTTVDGRSRAFDSFECAIHMLAPVCAHCGCKVIGHGAEHDGTIYCCAHCAKIAGVAGIDDRA